MKYDLSICIPAYNSSLVISELVSRLFYYFKDESIEIIIVNDGSRDSTDSVCKELELKYPHLKYYSLTKNFGEYNAVMCALSFSEARFVAIVDDDSQNPPESIAALWRKAQEGFDIVFAKYQEKKHSFLRNMISSAHNLLANHIMNKPSDIYLSTFKVINRSTVEEILKYKGPFPNLEVMAFHITNNITYCYVSHNERAAGKSNYTLRKLFHIWINIILSSSMVPVRLIAKLGLFLLVLSCMAIFYYLKVWIINNQFSQLGWILTIIFFFSSVQLLSVGIIGEYLGKMYLSSIQIPQWVIKKSRK